MWKMVGFPRQSLVVEWGWYCSLIICYILRTGQSIFSAKSSIHGSFSIARVSTGGYLDGFGPIREWQGKGRERLFFGAGCFFCDCLRVIFLGHLEFPYGDCYTWLMSLGPGSAAHASHFGVLLVYIGISRFRWITRFFLDHIAILHFLFFEKIHRVYDLVFSFTYPLPLIFFSSTCWKSPKMTSSLWFSPQPKGLQKFVGFPASYVWSRGIDILP